MAAVSTPPFRVTHVLLDVDGTLVDSGGAARAVQDAIASRCSALAGRDVGALDVIRLRQVVTDDPRWQGGSVHQIRQETIRRLLSENGLPGEGPSSDAAIDDVLAAVVDARTRALTVFDDVRGALAVLRARGLVLIAASNGDVDLECVGLAAYIDGTHYAHDVGVAKPDPRFFALALSRLGIPAHSALAVGDRLDNDYEPARAAGLHSLLLDRLGTVTDESVTRVASLAQLPALVASAAPASEPRVASRPALTR